MRKQIIFSILFFILLSSFAFASSFGVEETSEPYWNEISKITDNYTIEVESQNTQKTKICFWHKTATKNNDISSSYLIETSTGTISLNRLAVGDKIGYCRNVDAETELSMNPKLFYEPDQSVTYTTASNISFKSELFVDLGVSTRVNHNLWVIDGTVKKYGANASDILDEEEVVLWTNKLTITQKLHEDNKGYYVIDNDELIRLDFSDVCSPRQKKLYNGSDINNTVINPQCSFTLNEIYVTVDDPNFGLTSTFNHTELFIDAYSDWFYDPTYSIEQISSVSLNQTRYESDINIHLAMNETNLTSYWSFDQDTSSVGYDLTDNDNDGSYLSGANSSTVGCFAGECLQLDGVNDYFDISSGFPSDPDVFSASMWATADTMVRGRIIFGHRSESTRLIQLAVQTDNEVRYQIRGSGNSLQQATVAHNATEFSHYVITFDTINDEFLLYINGNLEGNISYNFGSETFTSTYTILGGAVISGSTPHSLTTMEGNVDDVIYFNDILTAQEVSNIYNNQSARFYDNGSITYNQITLNDTQYTGANVTFAGEANLNTSFKTQVSSWELSEGYNESLISGLVASYHADGNANDSSGNGNNGTFSNDANADGDGVFNRSFQLDGNGDSINAPDSSSLDLTTDITLNAWIKTSDTEYNYIITKWGGGTGKNSYYLALHPSNVLFFTTSLGGNYESSRDLSYVIDLHDGEWHMVTATYDGSTANIYSDGIFLSSKSLNGSVFNSASSLSVGGLGDGTNPLNNFNGSIDDALVFNKSLSEEEIKTLYNKGLANWQPTEIQDTNALNATHFQSNTINYTEGATNLLVSILPFSDTNAFYTPYVTGGVSIEVSSFTPPPPPSVTNLTLTITNPIDTEYISGTHIQTNITANKANVTYTYDLYRNLYGYEAENLTYVPNQTLEPNITGSYVLTIYGADNESTYANDSVNFIYVADIDYDTEGEFNMLAIILMVLGAAGLLLFASTQTTSNNMTAIRRIPEKVLLFITGLLMVPTAWYFVIVHVNATPSLSHLYAPLNTFFAILMLVIFALLFFYFYNMFKVLTLDQIGKKEDYDGEE